MPRRENERAPTIGRGARISIQEMGARCTRHRFTTSWRRCRPTRQHKSQVGSVDDSVAVDVCGVLADRGPCREDQCNVGTIADAIAFDVSEQEVLAGILVTVAIRVADS